MRATASFAEVSRQAGIAGEGNGLGAVAGDYDGDGDPDLYVANDLTPNFHYVNQGDGTFAETRLAGWDCAQCGRG